MVSRCSVNGGHPPSVDTALINSALFPALPGKGKDTETWAGLAQQGMQSEDR